MTVVGDVEVDVRFVTAQGEAALAKKLESIGGSQGAIKAPKIDTKETEAGVDNLAKFVSTKFQGIAGSSSSLVQNFKQVEAAGLDLGGLAGPVGLLTVATAAVGAAAVVAVRGFSSYAEEVRKFSVSSGLGAEESSRFVSALGRLGGSAEQARAAFFFLSRNVDANTPALQRHADLIVRNANGAVNLSATFLKAADAIHSTADAQERNAIAGALFGRQARDLVPVLSLGSDALERQLALTDKLGLTLDEQGIAKARAFTVAQNTLAQALKGVEVQVGGALAPALGRLAFAVTDVVTATEKFIRDNRWVVDTLRELASVLSLGILDQLGQLGDEQFKAAQSAAKLKDANDEQTASQLRVADALLRQLDTQDAADKAAQRYYQSALKVNDIQAQIAELQKGGGDAAKKLAAAQDELRSAYERLEDVQHKIDDSTVSITQKQSDLADAVLRFGPASHQALDAQKALNDAVFDQHRATEDLADAKKKVGDAGANEKDIQSNEKTRELADLNSQLAAAQGDVSDSAKALVKANTDNAVALDAVNDKTDDANDKLRIYRDELEKLAGQLSPNSDLQKHLDEVAAKLSLGLPGVTGRPSAEDIRLGTQAADRPPPIPAAAVAPGNLGGDFLGGEGGGGDGFRVSPGAIVVNAAPQQSPGQIANQIGFDLARRATSTAAPR